MKRKILTITLCVALLFALTFSLASCSSVQTFTVGNLSIDLNSTYFDATSIIPVGEEVELFASYLSLVDGLVVIPTFAPDTYDNLTMDEYVDAYADLIDGVVSYYQDDIPVINYEQAAEDYVFSVEAYVFEDDGGFWVVAFMNIFGDIGEKGETITGYVDSIVIE